MTSINLIKQIPTLSKCPHKKHLCLTDTAVEPRERCVHLTDIYGKTCKQISDGWLTGGDTSVISGPTWAQVRADPPGNVLYQQLGLSDSLAPALSAFLKRAYLQLKAFSFPRQREIGAPAGKMRTGRQVEKLQNSPGITQEQGCLCYHTHLSARLLDTPQSSLLTAPLRAQCVSCNCRAGVSACMILCVFVICFLSRRVVLSQT